MTLKENMQALIQNEYVAMGKSGKFTFTRKFYEEWDSQKLPAVSGLTKTERFIKFIQDAEVPQRLEDTRGNTYPTNKYSVEAEKEFNRMLDLQGINYDLLVKTVKLYYKSGIRLKKAIGNYITTGTWRTDYEALKNAAGTGENTLHKHIENELKNGSHTAFSF